MLRIVVCLLLVLALPAQAESVTVWVHGHVPESNEVTGMQEVPWSTGETLWLNGDAVDDRANDTASGPGYCPAPFDGELGDLGSPGCLATRSMVSGVDRPQGTFNHTFVIAWNGTGGALAFDPDGAAVASMRIGANSGNCTGTVATSLLAGDDVVADWGILDLNYTDGYVDVVAEAPVQQPNLSDRSVLEWRIQVECAGSGMFLGIADDPGRSFVALPLPPPPAPEPPAPAPQPEPEPGPEPEPEPVPEPVPEPEPEPEPTNEPHGTEDAKESPAPALGVLLGLALARRRLP